jgi:hypothetical protein
MIKLLRTYFNNISSKKLVTGLGKGSRFCGERFDWHRW